LVPDDQFIDLKEIVEKAISAADFDTPAGAHGNSSMVLRR
jgi:hypothetical protein